MCSLLLFEIVIIEGEFARSWLAETELWGDDGQIRVTGLSGLELPLGVSGQAGRQAAGTQLEM